jgi:serine/threonine protein kinase
MEIGFIGPYRIVEELGAGSMGVVYRARHASSERAVALKTVKVPVPRLLDGIRREIHALTNIRHPGVVRIVDNGVYQGRPWYAMDLLEGESLRSFGKRIWSRYRKPWPAVGATEAVSATEGLSADLTTSGEPLREPPPRPSAHVAEQAPAAAGELRAVVQIIRRVCATLAFLHGEGFINRDLKPGNILLVRGGQPVIIDFGLTAYHPGGTGREALEAQRGTEGTIPYMSPEQIRGEFVDARSDLYSVGCLLYELVAGAPPFSGAPRAVLSQHLWSAPVPPSQLVSGVPPALERVILKLLEKGLADRFGHADEVAAELADLGDDVRRLPDFPPARSYLYRPRFVGRDAIVTQLAGLRDSAFAGAGALVLLGGESGVGKTRVAMELTRFAPSARMQIVTSEATTLSSESAAAIGSAPLHTLRPLLQAVADRCQEGGPDVTERLLGDRRSLLALYEPLLAQVPARGSAPPPPLALSVEASRQRLFKYLSETLAALAREQPLLWVLDDLGWADELSLAFLQSLNGEYLAKTPLFILCTYRSEETTDGVAAIAALPHVTHLMLPRLDRGAVQSMVGDMLALPEPPPGFVEFVSRQAEGNPFFVAEYLRTAVTERILYRDQHHSWQLLGRRGGDAEEYESLLLPRSLRELIEQRLRRLSPAARQAGLAAAVLGREADIDVVCEVAALSDDAAVGAMDELLRRQVLEQPEPGRVRFAHDKLREVAYADVGQERLGDFHARAATALETRFADRPEANRVWATLGHHFASAKRAEPAARYLKLAADHARATHANGEAIRLYREAINQVTQMMLQLTSDGASWNGGLLDLYEALADVLSLGSQRAEARAAYDEALSRTAAERRTARARLYRKVGKTWETQHEHENALINYGLAREVLAAMPVGPSSEARDEWIQVRVDQLWVYYWLNSLREMDVLSRELQPVIERSASPLQRARFLRTQWMRNLRRDRYVAREETVGFARSALAASNESGDAAQILADHFGLGFVLLFHHQPKACAEQLGTAMLMAERGGDLDRQARCLAYLALAARMRGSIEETRTYLDRSVEVAVAAGMRDYVATARANQAWLSLRNRDLAGAIQYAREALEIWRNLTFAFPLQWIALLPRLEAALGLKDVEQAASCAEALLDPSQQLLTGSASDALRRACRSWRGGDRAATVSALEVALKYLERSGYG